VASSANLPRVAILDDYLHVAKECADWSAVAGRCRIDVIDRKLGVPEEAAQVLAPYEVLCHLRERTAMPAALLERLPKLRFMTVTGKAHRTLDLAAATARGVAVSHVSAGDPPSHGAPELAWGLVLAVARHIVFEDRQLRAGRWQGTLGMELHGKTLGLLGLGALGQRMARYGQAFGMKVIAWSPNLTTEAAEAVGVERVDKDALFRQSDVLSIHLVLGERSRRLVGAGELKMMKRSAVLVNTARGPIVDEAALVEALSGGWIAGAGLDVFESEPLGPGSPLRHMDNVVLTPHMGYATRDTFERFYQATVKGVAGYLDRRPVHLLNPEVWPALAS
jgi:phosphoglycerate dehydrogenase-like enzyme